MPPQNFSRIELLGGLLACGVRYNDSNGNFQHGWARNDSDQLPEGDPKRQPVSFYFEARTGQGTLVLQPGESAQRPASWLENETHLDEGEWTMNPVWDTDPQSPTFGQIIQGVKITHAYPSRPGDTTQWIETA